MAYKSGYCGTGGNAHRRCTVIMRNGSLASTRYILCYCPCHDKDEEALAAVMEMCGAWDVPQPLSSDLSEMMRYVDLVNILASPRRNVNEEN